LQRCVRDLNHHYREFESFHAIDFEYTGFEWIDFADSEKSVISFLRKGRRAGDPILVVSNFTPVPRLKYSVGVPHGGYYRELFNSDSELYGGSNLGNQGGVMAEESPSQGRPYSIRLTLPPLAVLYLRGERQERED
jgi:1,4-alpha-glucan branching enzyme